MKGKICGLLSALFITLGLSLSINLNDTKALKYSYSAFPVIQKSIAVGQNPVSHDSSSTFSITFDSYASSLQAPSGVVNEFYDFSGECRSTGQRNIFIKDGNTIGSGSSNGIYRIYNALPPLSSDYSSPSSFLSSEAECHNRSNYDYDSIYGGTINISTGDYDKYVDLSRIVNMQNGGGVKSIQVPLDISQKNVGSIPAGTPLSWTFELFTDTPFDNVSSSPLVDFQLTYFAANADTWTGTAANFASTRTLDHGTCTVDPNHEFLSVHEDMTFTHNYGYKVDCSYVAPTDMSYIYAVLLLAGDSNFSSNLFDYHTYLYFGSSYLITNNDDTYSGLDANDAPSGDNLDDAPGYATLYCDNAATCDRPSDDGMFGLTQLFNFTFINPFRALFDLFTNNSSCAQIPTIAGLIHSNETQVCPWFDSNVRNIVTPVLGLSSMMLLFGFAVRWLGASSGNMFEDSGSIEPPGYSATGGTAIHHGWRRKK